MARGDPVLSILGQAAAAEQAMPAPTALRAKRIGSRPRLVQVCKTASIASRPPTYPRSGLSSTMRCSEPGHRAPVAIHASGGPGR